uniref:Arachidonate--CoA ligase n=1 Tax=Neogobius melanostomus TaxID=47308 RepID=A0A8C6UUC6_9GOBI
MSVNEWLRSLCSNLGHSESERPRSILSSLPLSTPSLLGLGALASAIAYWLMTRPRPMRPSVDLQAQSVAVDGDPCCRRSALLPDNKLQDFYYEDSKTAYAIFQRGIKVSGGGPCLGYRKPGQPYEWISYTEVAEQAQLLGSGLLAKGCQSNSSQFVGIFAQNRPEWTISQLACYTYSMVLVPLYETLGMEAMVHILDLGKINIKRIVMSYYCKLHNIKHIHRHTDYSRLRTPKIHCFRKTVAICIITVTSLSLDKCPPFSTNKLRFSLWLCSNNLFIFFWGPGKPKGAMITHGNIASNISSVIKVLEVCVYTSDSMSTLTMLNASLFQVTLFCHGARVGFYQGEISLLMDDIKTLKPAFLPVVPRLLNRIYDKILGSVTSPLRRTLLNFAVRRKQAELRSGVVRNDSLWDKLVFKKIQASLGGKLRFALTTSAPISPTVLSFLRATLGCVIFEGYGQTECTGGCTFSMPGDWTAGHVGAPVPGALVKVVDIPEMNYLTKNQEGEVCIKGPIVFKGYLRDPERTAEALDSDGWLHTGDVGQWLPNGTLRIIDRKKNIFKLSQGEYIAPEKIENVYMRCVPVLQVFVHGDSLQSYLIGIVVPDPEVFVDWAKERGIVGSHQELCQNPDVKNAVLEDLKDVGKKAGLKSFEQVKDLYLHPEMFSIANGLLTPTLKSRRNDIRRVFQEQLSAMYSKTTI